MYCVVQAFSHVPWTRPHGLQHARPPCPSPTPGACSDSCPLSRWCHPTLSSSVVPFPSCPQSFPASGSFPMGWLFPLGDIMQQTWEMTEGGKPESDEITQLCSCLKDLHGEALWGLSVTSRDQVDCPYRTLPRCPRQRFSLSHVISRRGLFPLVSGEITALRNDFSETETTRIHWTMLWKCCTQCVSKSGELSSGHRTGKCQGSFQSQRKAMPKDG